MKIIKFQYPEGWKAFRYVVCHLTNTVYAEPVSIPRRVEGLPIHDSSGPFLIMEPCFNTPKGGRPSDT